MRAKGRFKRATVSCLREGDYVWLPAFEDQPEECATVLSNDANGCVAEVDRQYRGKKEDGLRELADDSPIYVDTW